GPRSPSALRRLLGDTRQRGYATEDGEVTAGFASLAVSIASAPSDPTFASIAVTFAGDDDTPPVERIVPALQATAAEVTRRLRGRTR
ncbi:MAG: IclR family transcriptional regulator, partial [Nocardioidaceae bacterium]